MDLPFEPEMPARTPASTSTPTPSSPQPPAAAPSLCGLILPAKLDAALHEGALRLVAEAAPDLQQRLLDELEGNLRNPRKTLHNPLGWFKGLVENSLAGKVVFTLAAGVATARESRKAAEMRMASAMNVTGAVEAAGDLPHSPKSDEAANAFRARYQQQRREILGRGAATTADGATVDQSDPDGREEVTR